MYFLYLQEFHLLSKFNCVLNDMSKIKRKQSYIYKYFHF